MNEGQERRKIDHVMYTIPIGAGLGVALGLLLMTALDHNGLFALGNAIGLTVGVTVGLVLDSKKGDGHVGY